jgi:hypothetical protein
MMRIFIFLLFALTACAPSDSSASPAATAQGVKRAIANARDGGIVTIAAGRYDIGEIKIRRNLTIIGTGEVVLYASAPVEKGLLNSLPGVSLRVVNITFKGAHSPDHNGAGIRHDGEHLTVIGSTFEGNENGILATGAASGRIAVFGSSFIDNGYCDGYSHGIYVSSGAVLEVFAAKFSGTKIGHHIKSLAERTDIRLSILDDADGRSSYAVDVSKGGDVTIRDNTIIQAANGDNAAIINYDLSRGGKATGLAILNNHIINRHQNGVLLRNAAPITPELTGNTIINEDRGKLAAP